MKLEKNTLKYLSIEADGGAMTVEQIKKCFNTMKEGGIILYRNKSYSYLKFPELLCALHQNGDITDKVLSKSESTYHQELVDIWRVGADKIKEIADKLRSEEKDKK